MDALLGITMAVTLVTLMTFAISDARNVFEYARERNLLLDAYDGHAGDIPLSTQTKNSWYGNDRIETVTTVSPADIGTSSAAAPRSPYTQSVSFSEIHIQPFSESADLAGTPLCSVDFTHHIYPKNGMLAADGMETSPEIVPVLLPVDHSLPLTDVEVRGDIAYVSADSTVYSAPDMVIVDISDRRYPSLIASVSSGPGIAAFKLAGNRVYAAAASTAAQLHIFSMDSLGELMIETTLRLVPPYATATLPMASAVYFDRDVVYLGTERWDGVEFIAIDVADPANPFVIGGLEIGSKVLDIVVRDDVAYISSAGEGQLVAADVSDPAYPIRLGGFGPSGWTRQEGRVSAVFENGLHLGRTSGGFDIRADHEIFSWIASSDYPDISAMPLDRPPPVSVNIPGGVYGLIPDRSHLYVASREIDREFQIFQHGLSTTSISIPLPISPQQLTCSSDRLYVLAHQSPFMYEISYP